MKTPRRLLWLAPLTTLVLQLPLQGQTLSYSISPKTAAAGASFALSLQSYQFNCGTAFSQLSSAISGNRITLSFLDRDNPNAVCPAVVMPYGPPPYALSGLKAGAYAVYAARLPACYESGCLAPIATQLVDTLRVADSVWFAQPKEVVPGKSFSLQLLNNKYGNCYNSFSHVSMTVQNGGLHASFVVEAHPERLCIADIHPHGPSFTVNALASGRYPIGVTEMPACLYAQPACAVPVPAERIVDTLTVRAAVSAVAPGSDEPALRRSGDDLLFWVPADWKDGRARIEVFTAEGSPVYPVQALPQGRYLRLQLAPAVKAGVYLLKLSAPGRPPFVQSFLWTGR